MSNKRTVLEIVQEVLNDMDADPVNSIDDTNESEQVAEILRSTYQAVISNRNWPHLHRLMPLVAVSDITKPFYLKVPDNVKEVNGVWYNHQEESSDRVDFKKLKWLDVDSFLRKLDNRNSKDVNVTSYEDYGGTDLLILTNKAPEYYTSFDDEYIVFDSFDSDVESTLQSSKSRLSCYIMPTLTLSDDEVPNLPPEAFTALIEEVKSRAAVKLNQTQDVKAEDESRRQNRWLANKAWTVDKGNRYPNYGRRGKR